MISSISAFPGKGRGQTPSAARVGGMRGLGQLIALGGALLSAVAVVAFLAKRPPQTPPGPSYAVAKVADVSSTPRPVSVVMRRGADRLQQREGTGLWPCNLANMGCPGTTELRATTIFSRAR